MISLDLAFAWCHQCMLWLNAEAHSCDVGADFGGFCENAAASERAVHSLTPLQSEIQ